MLGQHLARAFETKGSPQQLMEEAINRAIEDGEIRPVCPRQTMLTIVSSCVFPFLVAPTVKATNPEARKDFDAFVEARKDHVFHVIYDGLHVRQTSA